MRIRKHLKTTKHSIQKHLSFHPVLQVIYLKYLEKKRMYDSIAYQFINYNFRHWINYIRELHIS